MTIAELFRRQQAEAKAETDHSRSVSRARVIEMNRLQEINSGEYEDERLETQEPHD